MTDFTITEDFPKNKIEFDERFLNPTNCYDYLFKQKWPSGFICNKCGNSNYWLSSKNLYICTQCQHNHSLTAGTIMDSSKKPICTAPMNSASAYSAIFFLAPWLTSISQLKHARERLEANRGDLKPPLPDYLKETMELCQGCVNFDPVSVYLRDD